MEFITTRYKRYKLLHCLQKTIQAAFAIESNIGFRSLKDHMLILL